MTFVLLGAAEVLRLHADRVVADDEDLGVGEPDAVQHVAHVARPTPSLPFDAVNSHAVPPSKSMPRLRPA